MIMTITKIILLGNKQTSVVQFNRLPLTDSKSSYVDMLYCYVEDVGTPDVSQTCCFHVIKITTKTFAL